MQIKFHRSKQDSPFQEPIQRKHIRTPHNNHRYRQNHNPNASNAPLPLPKTAFYPPKSPSPPLDPSSHPPLNTLMHIHPIRLRLNNLFLPSEPPLLPQTPNSPHPTPSPHGPPKHCNHGPRFRNITHHTEAYPIAQKRRHGNPSAEPEEPRHAFEAEECVTDRSVGGEEAWDKQKSGDGE